VEKPRALLGADVVGIAITGKKRKDGVVMWRVGIGFL
jgi:hypothetical protein